MTTTQKAPASKAAASKSEPEPKPAAKPKSGRASLDQTTELVRVMYYGDPGKGKTTAMAGMARLGKVIFIDAERRLKPGPLRRLGVPIENIEVVQDVSYSALEALSFELADRLHGGEPIVGICWDSATETARILLQTLVDESVQQSLRAGKERSPWSTAIGDYGDMTEQMRRIIRRFRDLPIHLAVSCLPNRDTDEDGAIRVAPALTPAVLRDFMGYMDLVFHTRMELVGGVEEYSVLTKPIGKWEAKDSFGLFPRVLVDPSFDRVLAYVNGEIARDKDPVQKAAAEARRAVTGEETSA